MKQIATSIKQLLQPIKIFLEGDKDVRISIILDKNDTCNLEKAYVLVLIKEKYVKGARWKFAFKSRKGVVKLLPKNGSYALSFMYGNEYDRLKSFAKSQRIPFFKLVERLDSASRISTTKYFKHINKEEMIKNI